MVLLGLGAETRDHVGRKCTIRNYCFYCSYPVHVPFPRIFPVHELQYPGASALCRKMYMPADIIVTCDQFSRSSSEISFGCDVENLTLSSGLISATFSAMRRKVQFLPSVIHLYESTFCPRRVTSLYPDLKEIRGFPYYRFWIAASSPPLTYGTTQ